MDYVTGEDGAEVSDFAPAGPGVVRRIASLAANATVAVRIVLPMEKAMVERLCFGATVAWRLAVTASLWGTRLADNGRITTVLADANRPALGDERRRRSDDGRRITRVSFCNILRV